MKLSSKITLLGLSAFLAVSIFGYMHTYNKELNYDFDGVVKKVAYTKKGFPIIYFDNKTFEFANPYFLRYTDKISVGDTLQKSRGNLEIKIKPKSN
jgi:hypothetical protein